MLVCSLVQPPLERETDKALLWREKNTSVEAASGPNHAHARGHTTVSSDVDECLEQLDECHYNRLCENTPGGHHCACPRGYRQQGHSLPCLGKRDEGSSLGPGFH